MALRIFSTLSGKEEEFHPSSDVVRMYVCGMTPKFHPHVGHARLFVSMDVVRRYMEYRGYEVQHVQNFTDVDDKIIARGQREGIPAHEVAEKYTASYFEAMGALQVLPAHEYPKATHVIPSIVRFIQSLEERGYAYSVDGDVYYEVDAFTEYGKLSGRTEEEGVMAGARVEVEPGKHNPRDFALWKSAKPGEPAWDSPWGAGRPGWHIECSTMINETLGEQIDIHAGGRDLIFPHHENEIAQSEAYCQCSPFARYWVHVGLLNIGGEKMSHSLNNFLTIQQLLEKYEPAVLRLYLISIPYRAPMTYTEEGLDAAVRALARLRSALDTSVAGQQREPTRDEMDTVQRIVDSAQSGFVDAMDSDFNTAQALATLFDMSREMNRLRTQDGCPVAALEPARAKLLELGGVLGLLLDAPSARGADRAADPYVELLIELRTKLRAVKQWALADEVRDRLKELGVVLEDRPEGTVWKYAEKA